jgi:hypothetical protein
LKQITSFFTSANTYSHQRIRVCNISYQLATRVNRIGATRMSALASDLGQIRALFAELAAIRIAVAG